MIARAVHGDAGPRLVRRVAGWAIGTDASTRSVSLMRIALVAIVWARWADELVIYRQLGTDRAWLSLLFFLVTPLAFAGLFTRVSMALTALVALYLVYGVGHGQGHEPYTHHHTTLLAWSCAWIALAPCGRSYSVDRWLAIRRAERTGRPWPEERGNLWALRLIALQLASIYFWTALDKCNPGFLSGARLSHYVMAFYTGSAPIDEGAIGALFAIGAWLTLLLELSLAFGLFFAAGRRWLVIPGLLLHGAFYTVLTVATFTVTMWILYLACFDPDEVHRFLDRLQAPGPKGPALAPEETGGPARRGDRGGRRGRP